MAKTPPKKPKDPAKPTRAKAHRPEAPAHDPALDDLLNPGIARGRAGIGSGTGAQPPADNSFDRRTGAAGPDGARDPPSNRRRKIPSPAAGTPPSSTSRANRRRKVSRNARKAAM